MASSMRHMCIQISPVPPGCSAWVLTNQQDNRSPVTPFSPLVYMTEECLSRALYCLEMAWHPSFNVASGANCRLDFQVWMYGSVDLKVWTSRVDQLTAPHPSPLSYMVLDLSYHSYPPSLSPSSSFLSLLSP